jgi:DNA-binding NarL/FixJ family response regulator
MSIPKEHPTPIRVMIVDDHKSIVWGLERLVESAHPYMEIAGTANSCAQMLAIVGTEMPDVILLDLDLDGICAVDAIADIQRLSKARVLILTGDKDPDIHHAAFMNGAHGVIGKEAEADVLLHAIERVHSGEVWINRTMMGRVLGAMSTGTNGDGKRNPDATRIASLTPRERDIVRAIVRHRGAKSNVIAETVCISEHTLRNHLTVIYDKLDVRNRIDLYAYATEHGLAAA